MRTSLVYIALAIAVLFVDSAASALTCPTTTADWLKFRDQAALRIVRTTPASEDDDSSATNKAARDAQVMLETCKAPELAELAPLKRFSNARKHEARDGWLMGFNVPDAQYFKETTLMTAVPADLKTQDLLQAMSDPARIDEALKILTKKNEAYPDGKKLIFFRYVSQHLTTPDQSLVYGRVLIYVPALTAADPDRWVQFGVPEKGKPHTQNVSVVAVQKAADGHTDVYFKDHFRMFDEKDIYLKSRFEVDGSGDSCIECHKSGMLPIFPKPGSLSPFDQPKLDQVNAVAESYGPPAFGGYALPADLGPALGDDSDAAKQKRTPAFIAKCASKQKFADPASSHLKIAKSMNCASCHDASAGNYGAINYPLNTTLMDSFVKGGKMPPKNTLTAAERDGLLACLKTEYLGSGASPSEPALLLNWLKGLTP